MFFISLNVFIIKNIKMRGARELVKKCQYSADTVYTYVSGKMRPIETIQGMWQGGMKNAGGGEFKYDILDML
jgi:hypothetical protein